MNDRRTATLDPAPVPRRRGERAARVLVATVAAGLVLLASWPALSSHGTQVPADPVWEALAPPASVGMRPWRWLVVSARSAPAHLRISPATSDPARVEALGAWRLQEPLSGYPEDAVVIALAGRGDDPVVEARLAGLAAELLRRIPTLAIARLGADRLGPPPGLDQERLRFLVRERLGR